mgnify:CR=1 FL=1
MKSCNSAALDAIPGLTPLPLADLAALFRTSFARAIA